MFFYIIAIFTVILILITIILILSTITIKIEDLNICIPKIENRILNNNYKISIIIKTFKKIKILQLEITKKKLENLKIKSKAQQLQQKIEINKSKFDIKNLKILKQLKIQIKKVDLNINIGTENAATTAYLVGIISAILAIVLKKPKYTVNPIYINKNILNIRLDSIFEIKMIHIIYIIYILIKKGRDEKYGRTSNRRSYGYSYE